MVTGVADVAGTFAIAVGSDVPLRELLTERVGLPVFVDNDGYDLLGMSYDNTGGLSATSWRHVKFVEQFPEPYNGRWLMMSDVWCRM